MTCKKILIELNDKLKLVNQREYDSFVNKGISFKLVGSLNTNHTNKLNLTQLDMVMKSVISNQYYLANKSPDMLIKNFKDSVIRELK